MSDTLFSRLVHHGLEFFGRYYGSYRGYVLDNNDPKGMNRVKITCPNIHGDDPIGVWAYPKGQWGGKNYGISILPEKGDVVFVEFDHGDSDYPMWTHSGYGLTEKPEEFKELGTYGFKTPKGNIIIIDDTANPRILVKFKNTKEYIEIKEEQLELESKLIKLGKGGDEWAAMGETNVAKIEAICNKIESFMQDYINHTHPTSQGPSGAPLTAQTVETQKQEVIQIRESLNEILSGKVKIDR
jgi:hypothetical protein